MWHHRLKKTTFWLWLFTFRRFKSDNTNASTVEASNQSTPPKFQANCRLLFGQIGRNGQNGDCSVLICTFFNAFDIKEKKVYIYFGKFVLFFELNKMFVLELIVSSFRSLTIFVLYLLAIMWLFNFFKIYSGNSRIWTRITWTHKTVSNRPRKT